MVEHANAGQLSTSQLIDHIVYLASLASEPNKVDPILDKLRVITAKSSQPSSEDVKTLESIQAQLEDHLLHKERLRSFTEESLRQNVERHFGVKEPVAEARKSALWRILFTVVICSVIAGIPAALKLMGGQAALAFFICLLFVGLALLFQPIKKDLVMQLRGAVNYLVAAIIGTGLFALQFPIIAESKYLTSLPLLQHIGFLEFALPVYACYYIAAYLYAKQLNVTIPFLLKPVGVMVTGLIIAAIGALAPHPVPSAHEIYFDLAVSPFAVSVYFSGVAAILNFMSIPKTNQQYSKFMLLYAISNVLQMLGNGYLLIFVVFVSGDITVNQPKGQTISGALIVASLAFQYAAAYKARTTLRE